MKKTTLLLIVLMTALWLCGCEKGGDVSNLVVKETPSELYTQDEINDAIAVIKLDFSRSWSGCKLKEIAYAGDDATKREAEYYLKNDSPKTWGEFDQIIILVSSFDVDDTGGDGSLNPNDTYTSWKWILVRSSGGNWRHVDHGY